MPIDYRHDTVTDAEFAAISARLSVVTPKSTVATLPTDVTNGTAAVMTTFHTVTYTPVGSALLITGQGFAVAAGGNASVEIQIAGVSYPIFNLGYGVPFSRAVKVAVTPGVAVTANLRYAMSAGGFYCRAATPSTCEFASITVLDGIT